jgi:hypothetical protein
MVRYVVRSAILAHNYRVRIDFAASLDTIVAYELMRGRRCLGALPLEPD